MEYDRHRNLPDRDPGADPLSVDGVLHGTTGRAARRCGYLLDCRSARAGRALLRICARLAASRAAAAYPARLTPPATGGESLKSTRARLDTASENKRSAI